MLIPFPSEDWGCSSSATNAILQVFYHTVVSTRLQLLHPLLERSPCVSSPSYFSLLLSLFYKAIILKNEVGES